MATAKKTSSSSSKTNTKKTPTAAKGKGHINAGLAAYLAKKNKK